jgi:UDP-3-O-[3-hydroxymyristoyl] glucosamine N-acyltransferase
MMEQVQSIKVTTTEELKSTSDMIAQVKKLAKYIEGEKEKFTEPARAIITSAKEKYDPYIAQCKDAEKLLKEKAQVFMLAERKREEEEKKKIVAKVETGYIKPETAITKLFNVEVAPKTASTESSTLSIRIRKDVEIVNQALIPEEYYKPRELDMTKLRKVVTAGVFVPGTKLIEVPTMASA